MPLGYAAFTTPAGNVPPTLSGNNFTASFQNTAQFTNDPGASCAAGEYRQMVMGSFSVSGTMLTHVLCGTVLLSPAIFYEDGCPSGFCTAFGHRSCPPTPANQYLPVQATGPQFAMFCQPGFRNTQPGHVYTIDLTFQGKLINTTDNTVLVARTWTIVGQVASPVGSLAASDLHEADRIVGVHAARNLDHGGLEAQVVVSRSLDAAPLSAAAVTLVLRDEQGEPIGLGDAVVHEVVCGARATATIVYPIGDADRRPATGEVAANAANQIFKVLHR